MHNKNLKKAAKELFKHIQETQSFDFEGPSYVGLSDGAFNQLTPNDLDALVASVVILKDRIKQGDSLTSSDFVSLVKDQAEDLLPEVHQKVDKPGKKHGRKNNFDY